ncbi:MAG: YIP1 family protein [Candidatus Margulisiibacteriota bacterium]
MFKKYCDLFVLIWFRPILFFSRLPQGEWTGESVTFAGVVAWILAGLIAAVVFITQYIPIGGALWEGVPAGKLILVVPVIALLGAMFFFITFIILGGVLLALILGLFYALGALLFWSAKLLGGQGSFHETLKAGNYSSAILLIFILPIFMMIATKRGILDFTNFRIGFNITCSFAVLYLYGLQAIISRKLLGLSRPKAFTAALATATALAILFWVINIAILPKIAPWIM